MPEDINTEPESPSESPEEHEPIPSVSSSRARPRRFAPVNKLTKKPWILGIVLLLLVAGAYGVFPYKRTADNNSTGIHKIKHIIVIMQENRSFDSYFGTFPGADGIPMQNGVPTVCVPDPASGQCVKPYHDTADLNTGGPHGQSNAIADIDGGKMDGFIAQSEGKNKGCGNAPECASSSTSDVMGYHTAAEIPNYWTYAKDFVLNDHLFESNASWSLPSHLYMVSEWSAKCSQIGNPQSCVNALQNPGNPPDFNTKASKNIIKQCAKGNHTPACQKALSAIGITPDIASQLQKLTDYGGKN